MQKKVIISFLICFFFYNLLWAAEQNNLSKSNSFNYHFVGWFNTFIPGGGELLNGNYDGSALQLGLEVGTFGIGYKMSKREPMTLDGVPEALPTPYQYKSKTTVNRIIGAHLNGNSALVDKAMAADVLQEFGLKYHMVNVYNSYRDAEQMNGIDNTWIDKTSTKDLFLAPFKSEVMSDPWVYVPIGVTALAVIANYFLIQQNIPPVARVGAGADAFYGTTYMVVFPIGSGAPEEMFYRGFIQNEAYSVIPSLLFSVSVSTLAFAFSHSADDRLSAGVSGLYEGFLVHKQHGKLSDAIAYHFWSDVITGAFTTVLFIKAQKHQGGLNRNQSSQPIAFITSFNI